MDAKITKQRMGRMLSYDWLKIVGLAAAIIFFWVLVFTTTATRIKPSQQFGVANYMGNVSATSNLQNHLNGALSDGKFSHEVLETTAVDIALDESTAYQLLEARMATNELDAMLVSQEGDPSSATTAEDGSTVYSLTYLDRFTNSYYHQLYDVELLLSEMAAYLNGYYGGDYTNESALDKAKIEGDFRARLAAKKDKRYKKEAQIQTGIQGEIERVQKYRAALISFTEYLGKGYISLTKLSYEYEGIEYFKDRAYSVNICPETAPKAMREKMASFVGYYKTYTDESGTEQTTVAAENMQVCLINDGGDRDFRFEGVLYVTQLVAAALA